MANIKIDSSSYVDPNGFLFWHKDEAYRLIYEEAAPFYLSLFEDGTIAKLMAENHLVKSEPISDPKFNLKQTGLILKHETLSPNTYCVEWCPSMLQDAALTALNLSKVLLHHNCMLQDAYPWNILFRGPEPIYVDFTSIVPLSKELIWPAYEQFLAFFLRPLLLSAMGKGEIARKLLLNNISGIDLHTFLLNASVGFKVTHPLQLLIAKLDTYIQKNHNLKKSLKSYIQKNSREISKELRNRFYTTLINNISALSFNQAGDLWKEYYNTIPRHVNKQAKLVRIKSLVENLKCKTLLDLGSNTGIFSLICAELGMKVISVDQSQECMEQLYHSAKRKNINITPIVSDVLCPTPPFGFIGEQYPSLFDRVKSEIVLCLGFNASFTRKW